MKGKRYTEEQIIRILREAEFTGIGTFTQGMRKGSSTEGAGSKLQAATYSQDTGAQGQVPGHDTMTGAQDAMSDTAGRPGLVSRMDALMRH
jgi:hypothetical protein